MKRKRILSAVYLLCILAACQTAIADIETRVNNEFTLARDQSVEIKGTPLRVTFNSVLSDDRCPVEVECASNGPVTISLSIQQEGEDIPFNITLQTFTDQEGRAPESEFEGVEASADLGDYLIRVVGVLPYPRNLSGIKASDYQATFIVIPK